MKTKIWSVSDIQEAMTANGSKWWHYDNMRMFGTRPVGHCFNGPNGVFFATSDKQFDGSRAYTVRQFTPETLDISTIGYMGGYANRQTAINAARRLAGADNYREASFQPISEFEQFLADLHEHGAKPTKTEARDLIRLATRHAQIMVDYCNGVDPYDEEGEPKPRLKRCIDRITSICRVMGCKPVFSGDPRGCTVKLFLPDGYTNDWGKEGFCVPTKN
jgi:hypothetical protein